MKSLHTIQTLAKVGKVLSKVVFVFCIIGIVGSLMGLLSLALVGSEALIIGGIPITSGIENAAEVSVEMMCVTMIAGMISCIGDVVLAKYAERYFNNELAAGTPFTLEGANELYRLGILAIAIPLGTMIIESIIYGVASAIMEGLDGMDYSNDVSISLGITFIIISIIFRYGAELTEKHTEPMA